MIGRLKEKMKIDGKIMLSVKVKPASPKNAWQGELSDGTVKISLKARAEDGKANLALAKFLSDEFDVQQSQVKIIKGKSSRQKLVLIKNSRSSTNVAACN